MIKTLRKTGSPFDFFKKIVQKVENYCLFVKCVVFGNSFWSAHNLTMYHTADQGAVITLSMTSSLFL